MAKILFGYQKNNSNCLKIKSDSIPVYLYELLVLFVSGYHADTPITIKAEAILKADSHSH